MCTPQIYCTLAAKNGVGVDAVVVGVAGRGAAGGRGRAAPPATGVQRLTSLPPLDRLKALKTLTLDGCSGLTSLPSLDTPPLSRMHTVHRRRSSSVHTRTARVGRADS